MAKKIRLLMFFSILLILVFIYSYFLINVFGDEIWNYGFSYNIASGLIPYRDFGMLQTPLYFLLASIFIKIFGSYLFSFHLFNSFVLASIIYIFYYKLKYKGFILIPFVFLNCYPSYNIFSILILLIILILLDKKFKFKDYTIGLLVGIMFLVKQHIGIVLLIPMLYYSKKRLKGLIGFISPIMLFFVYLIYNSAFYEFVDYCFLGIFDFGESNSIWFFFPIEFIICLIILYKLIQSKFKNKSLFYLLMYQVVTVPIFDDYHFMIGMIPVLYYLLLVSKIEKYKIKYYIIISLFTFFCWTFKIHEFDNLNFYEDKNSYLYGRNVPTYVNLEEISDYIKEQSMVYDHIYFFSKNAFYVKLHAGYPLDKYDMICNGNMGYNGSVRYIEEINEYCDNHSCMFILYRYEFENKLTQTNREIFGYVMDNYKMKEEVYWFDIYSN